MPDHTKRKARPSSRRRKPASEGAPRPGVRPLWSGTLSFGLVSIPVELYPAARHVRAALHMLGPGGTPLSRRYFARKGPPLDASEIERGYEIKKGKFVVVTDEELEALLPDQSRDIDLTRFVERAEISPIFVEKSYLLAPAGNSNLAYRLLASTMERLDKVGIATFVMREKQYLVAIRAEEGLLRADTLRFADELRTPKELGFGKPKPAPSGKVRNFKGLIARLTRASVPERELRDAYWERVQSLVERKKKQGVGWVESHPGTAEEGPGAEVIDLMEVLRKSLEQPGGAQPKRRKARK